MSHRADRIAANVAAIRQRMAAAAGRSGRTAADVRLVAVVKYADVEDTRAVIAAGCADLGESRPQALWTKTAELADQPGLRWHMIGHLQRNKVRRTVELATLIHSGDSLRLLAAVDDASAMLGGSASLADQPAIRLNRRIPILLEVNISGDASKHGFAPEQLERHLATIAGWSRLEVRGLMAMASREGDLAAARRDFARLRTLRDALVPNCPSPIRLDGLSMGMSGDFEVAIEEGATIVRVGSDLFDGLDEGGTP